MDSNSRLLLRIEWENFGSRSELGWVIHVIIAYRPLGLASKRVNVLLIPGNLFLE